MLARMGCYCKIMVLNLKAHIITHQRVTVDDALSKL